MGEFIDSARGTARCRFPLSANGRNDAASLGASNFLAEEAPSEPFEILFAIPNLADQRRISVYCDRFRKSRLHAIGFIR